jgi:hypothetical protein
MKALVMATALAVAAAAVPPQPAQAHGPQAIPPTLVVPAGNKLFLEGHAFGTQNYMCLPSASAPAGVAWFNVGPQATLFADNGRQIITHFLSPNPDEGGLARATWQHSRETSAVWAVPDADPVFVETGAIPWLRLHFVGRVEGPTGGDTLAQTTYIQRINTAGGLAPTTGCTGVTDVGKRFFSPYEADYLFYKEPRAGHD